ncbi:MAG: DUF5915 domain-containing protein, partial [Flavitalea sp.]
IMTKGMEKQIELIADLVKSEVNVKEIEYISADAGFIKKKVKPNFVALGKKLGPKMKAVSAAIGAFTPEQITQLEKDGSYPLLIDNEPLILHINEVDISSEDMEGWIVANKGLLTVALDVTLTEELVSEGNARELVNRIQKIRKDSDFELTDRIVVKLTGHDALNASLARFNSYICAEILADNIEVVPDLQDGTQIEVNDISLKVFVTKKA